MDQNLEQKALKIYNCVLEKIMYPALGKGITFSDKLKKVGCQLFGRKFAGVFDSDSIPNLTNKTPYAIINLDGRHEPGSHWIAIAHFGNNIMVYDSFGRNTKQIIPKLVAKSLKQNINLLMADPDPEQEISEDTCGQRSLAWLYVFEKYGESVAKLI